MPKFSIIIPIYGQEQMTRECLEKIAAYTHDFEIIAVVNGGNFSMDLAGKIIHNKENLGFPKAVNQGIKAATGDIIIILNNDVFVTPNWADHLAEHLQKVDLVGPVTNNVSGPQKIEDKKFFDEAERVNFSRQRHIKNRGVLTPFHRLVFFCVAFKRSVIDRIGLLDEQFTPGNFEDDDYCLRAVEAGFKLAYAEDVFVQHLGSVTHKALNLDYQTLMQTNLAKFQAKWPQARYNELVTQSLRNFSEKVLNPASPLSLVMIVKNEEKGLERAILSCRGLVSNIVIAIDNLSTDLTERIAQRYANTIKHFDFKDDYAAARNFAQEGVKTPWIIFLDGHEYVKQAPGLLEALKKDCDGLLTTVEMENGSTFRNPRIFKSSVKFEGAIHEQQQCKKPLLYPGFIVKHDRNGGQDPKSALERAEQRDRQLPEIMGAQLKKDPKNTRASFHLFLHYAGRQQNKEAKKYAKIFLKYSEDKSQRWLVYFNIALSHMARGHYFRAYINITAADREIPNRWENSKLIGMILVGKKDYTRALDFLVNSLSDNKSDNHFKPWPRNLEQTWNLIGECFFNLGEYWKAAQSFRQAVKYATEPQFKILLNSRAELMEKMAANVKPIC
jgi:GT2 family glycosyltransferase